VASIRRKSGSKFYYACFRGADGLRHQESTKEMSRNRAMRIALELEEAARNCNSRAALQQRFNQISVDLFSEALPSDSVREYFERAMRERAGEIKPSTARRYQQAQADFCEFLGPVADKPLRGVTRSQVIAFRAAVAKRTTAANANALIKGLRTFFTRAQEDNIVTENPTLRLKPLAEVERDPSEKRRAFTPEEIVRIKKAAAKAGPEWLQMVEIGSITGQRLADVACMNWGEIVPANDRIMVWGFRSRKTKRHMSVPIPVSYVEGIRVAIPTGAPGTPGQVFPHAAAQHAKTNSSNSLSNQFYDILASIGIVPPRNHKAHKEGRRGARTPNQVSFHCFRHTVTSMLNAAGVPRSVIMDIVGHDSVESSLVYTHAEMVEKEEAQEKLRARLGTV
jgi:integrase